MPPVKPPQSISCRMILHFTSAMNSFQRCHSSCGAGIFQSSPSLNWHCVTLQRINAFPARRQMCSLWVEWSTNHGDCQTELGLIKHWSRRQAAVSVCVCLHTGEYSATKTPNNTWISSLCRGYLIFSRSRCHAASRSGCLWCRRDVTVGAAEGVWRHAAVHGSSCVQRYHCSGCRSGIVFTPALRGNSHVTSLSAFNNCYMTVQWFK